MNSFTDISYGVSNAIAEIEGAISDIDENFTPDYAEMNAVREKLVAVKVELENIFPPSIIKAIEEEEAYNDEMSDRAEAAGY